MKDTSSSHCLSACIPFETGERLPHATNDYMFPLPIGMYPFRDRNVVDQMNEEAAVPIAYRHVSLSRPDPASPRSSAVAVPIAYRHVSLSRLRYRAKLAANGTCSHCLSACIPFETVNLLSYTITSTRFPLPIGMYPFRDVQSLHA